MLLLSTLLAFLIHSGICRELTLKQPRLHLRTEAVVVCDLSVRILQVQRTMLENCSGPRRALFLKVKLAFHDVHQVVCVACSS